MDAFWVGSRSSAEVSEFISYPTGVPFHSAKVRGSTPLDRSLGRCQKLLTQVGCPLSTLGGGSLLLLH